MNNHCRHNHHLEIAHTINGPHIYCYQCKGMAQTPKPLPATWQLTLTPTVISIQ